MRNRQRGPWVVMFRCSECAFETAPPYGDRCAISDNGLCPVCGADTRFFNRRVVRWRHTGVWWKPWTRHHGHWEGRETP